MKMNPVTPNFTGMLKVCLPPDRYGGNKAEIAVNTNCISSITPPFKDIVHITYRGGAFNIKAPIDKVLEAYRDAEKNGIGCIVDADY